MSLHVEIQGSGEPLILLHGWGWHGGIWREAAEQLSQYNQVFSIDLPGYGYSTLNDAISEISAEKALNNLVAQLAAQFPQTLTVCGWSLGGQIALRWAQRYPQHVQRLILIASTPCFRQREDWAHGMSSDLLAQFAADLSQNHAATLRRFLALQLRGCDNERALLAALREQLFSRGEANLSALHSGLAILRDVDLRPELPQITQPTLVFSGERDKLTPPAASQYLASTIPNARLHTISGASHAPFLSHPEEFTQAVRRFLEVNLAEFY
jgi:pimeloyl-[acyl-carrier protein] methyl ester esterase